MGIGELWSGGCDVGPVDPHSAAGTVPSPAQYCPMLRAQTYCKWFSCVCSRRWQEVCVLQISLSKRRGYLSQGHRISESFPLSAEHL